MNNENDSGVNGWKVMSLVLTVVLAAFVCVFFVMRGGTDASGRKDEAKEEASAAAEAGTEAPAGEETASDTTAGETGADTGTSGTEGTPDTAVKEEETETFDIGITFADGFNHTRIVGTTAYILEGFNNHTGEAIRTMVSDKMGRVQTSLPAGDYTLVFGDEAYYDGMENFTVGGPDGPGNAFFSDRDKEGYVYWKYLLPRQSGNTICMVLEWIGSDDLDLCVFNATAKRYINVVQPEDGDGCYLVEDDWEGSPGWEVVVIRDYTKSEVYTPFIRDGNSLMHGSLSAMEANGVRLSILDSNGLMFSKQASPEEHAALWVPCYIHKGKVISEEVYEYDPARYAWAAYAKN